ncbi:Uncharacterised protein [Candidatus Tiddalikarchaeum anstoanum]|nr:Uncharacterised protein [Candidatus Tiddalikarchaeum anstoanum]
MNKKLFNLWFSNLSDMAEKKSECICPSCPSFVKGKEPVGYCFHGKSKVIKVEKGCICMTCPIHTENKYRHGYYCTKGSEKQINKN